MYIFSYLTLLLLSLSLNGMSESDMHGCSSESLPILMCDEIYDTDNNLDDCESNISIDEADSLHERCMNVRIRNIKIRLWANASLEDERWTCIKCKATRSNRDTFSIMSHMSSVHNICCLCEEPHEFENRESLLDHYLESYPGSSLIKRIDGYEKKIDSYKKRHNRVNQDYLGAAIILSADKNGNLEIASRKSDSYIKPKKSCNMQVKLWIARAQEYWVCPECFRQRDKQRSSIIYHMATAHEKCYQCKDNQTFETRKEIYDHCWDCHPNTSITKRIKINKRNISYNIRKYTAHKKSV